MGMDVYSKGEKHYFRRNVWGWHPLATYLQDRHATITAPCAGWHTNSGDGLDAAGSAALAAALRSDLLDGSAAAYLVERLDQLGRLPRQRCDLCGGTGVRTDEVGVQYGYDHRVFNEAEWKWSGGCNACGGTGTTDDFALSYHLRLIDLAEFADFLELAATDGGFSIY
jgi:hypothetical protein